MTELQRDNGYNFYIFNCSGYCNNYCFNGIIESLEHGINNNEQHVKYHSMQCRRSSTMSNRKIVNAFQMYCYTVITEKRERKKEQKKEKRLSSVI